MKNVWQNALWCKSGNSFVVSVIRSIYEAICVMHTICLQWLWEPGCVYQVRQKSNLQSFAVFSATTWNVSLKFYMFMCCSCLHLTAKWHLRIYYVWGAIFKAYHKLQPKPKSVTKLEALQVIWDNAARSFKLGLLRPPDFCDRLTVRKKTG